MATPVTRDLIDAAKQAGYQVLAAEHPRNSRWLLTLRDTAGISIILVVQVRPLISAYDIQDLDDGGFCITPQKSAVGLLPLFCSRIGEQKSETSADQMAQNL
jgi:hypothetical protein